MRDYYDLARGMEEADQHVLEKNVQEDMKTNRENETGTKPQGVIREPETDTMARTETLIRPDQKEERIREAEEASWHRCNRIIPGKKWRNMEISGKMDRKYLRTATMG